MMDRAKKDDLPKMQVGFIDFVCMPVYEVSLLFRKRRFHEAPLLPGSFGPTNTSVSFFMFYFLECCFDSLTMNDHYKSCRLWNVKSISSKV